MAVFFAISQQAVRTVEVAGDVVHGLVDELGQLVISAVRAAGDDVAWTFRVGAFIMKILVLFEAVYLLPIR